MEITLFKIVYAQQNKHLSRYDVTGNSRVVVQSSPSTSKTSFSGIWLLLACQCMQAVLLASLELHKEPSW